MTVKALASLIGVWLSLGLVGGFVDGQILRGYDTTGAGEHTGDAADLLGATQLNIETQETGFFDNVAKWFAAPVNFLKAWANILALNSSLFTGDFAVLGWIVRFLLGGPIVVLMLISIFGR